MRLGLIQLGNASLRGHCHQDDLEFILIKAYVIYFIKFDAPLTPFDLGNDLDEVDHVSLDEDELQIKAYVIYFIKFVAKVKRC